MYGFGIGILVDNLLFVYNMKDHWPFLVVMLQTFISVCLQRNIVEKTSVLVLTCLSVITVNDYQQYATVLAYSFILNQLYMFRAMSSPVGELVCSLKDPSSTQTRVITFHHLYYHYYQPLQAKYEDYNSTSSTLPIIRNT